MLETITKPKRVLVISYHFPPYGGGGVIRIHNFVKYLSLYGYQPTVLTADELYYENTYRSRDLAAEVPASVQVVRTKCLEPSSWKFKDKVYGVRNQSRTDRIILRWGKKLIKPCIFPDRAITWFPFAVKAGMSLLNKERFDLILATSPPFTASLVAMTLGRKSQVPFILDFRDDWVGNPLYSSSFRGKQRLEKWVEGRMVAKSKQVICASKASLEMFHVKYPWINPDRYSILPNGFDPQYFSRQRKNFSSPSPQIRCVHAGSLTEKRTPIFFLQAVSRLIKQHPELEGIFQIRLLGYIPRAIQARIESDLSNLEIKFENNLSPREVARILVEETDLCLLFQRRSEGGDTAIPGKLYEYLAARKPILCMAEDGATPRFLQELGSKLNCAYQDIPAIAKLLGKIVELKNTNNLSWSLDEKKLKQFNRKEQTRQLAQIFNLVTDHE